MQSQKFFTAQSEPILLFLGAKGFDVVFFFVEKECSLIELLMGSKVEAVSLLVNRILVVLET